MPCLKHLKDIPWVWVLKSISATKYAPKGLLWTAVTQNYRLLSSNLPVLPFENQLAQNNSVLETKEGLEGIWMWSPSMTVPACSKASAGNSRDLGSMTQEFHPCSLYGMMEQLQACPFASASFYLDDQPQFCASILLEMTYPALVPTVPPFPQMLQAHSLHWVMLPLPSSHHWSRENKWQLRKDLAPLEAGNPRALRWSAEQRCWC